MSDAVRLIVALETSARPSSIAVARGAGDAVERSLTADRAHASDLLVELAELAREVECDRSDLDLVIVGTGPGSYTGLRVGAATALGLHRGAGAALVGVPSFEAIAWSGLAVGESGMVVRNAFGGQVYRALYERTRDGVRTIVEPACVRPSEVVAALGSSAGRSGNGPGGNGLGGAALLLADADAVSALGDTLGAADIVLRSDVVASAGALLAIGRARFERDGAHDPGAVRPLYLRPFEVRLRTR